MALVAAGLAAIVLALVAACGGAGPTPTGTQVGQQPTPTTTPSGSQSTIRLNGAGATFPFPLYSRWFDEYARVAKTQVNYQSIGSGGGIRQVTEGTVDFGASDGIMTNDQQAKAEQAHGPILHIPMTMGAVAVVYNLQGIGAGQVKLTPDVLADIYLKKITRWSDSRIAQLNPGLNLSNQDIAVVHRSDGSGTTFIFTNYLSKVSQEWKEKVGNATAVNWPGDIGGQGNEGVAGQVRQIPGTIGYVELAYATQNNMAWAALQNASSKFVEPSLQATSKAALGVPLPDDMKVMITNSTNPEAYSIAGFTWLLVYRNQTDCTKGKALVDVLWWAIHDGQQYAPSLQYAPLPDDAVRKAEAQIRSVTCNGQPLLGR
ncbi:MAG: phosphate ABC transporter substrate-binding protein PstS [Chloroflexi bacterium]|nr:phosphate ABC transporter substrate-binding protein PstS [Chloroflexota bacterium]